MHRVVRGDELGDAYRRRIAAVLVDGFADDFAYLSPDPEKLVDLFEHMILLDRFYAVDLDGEPAAVASLTTRDEQCFAPRWREFQRHLGRVRGLLAYLFVRSQFLGTYDGSRKGLAEIGFVATATAHQRQGLGTELLTHLLDLPQYGEYVVEDIKDTNAAALSLFTTLGFTEYTRRSERFAEYVTMKLVQD